MIIPLEDFMADKLINLRIPESIYKDLKAYQEENKPHMSMNAIIVDAILADVRKQYDSQQGRELREFMIEAAR
jgi:hypothetical protein